MVILGKNEPQAAPAAAASGSSSAKLKPPIKKGKSAAGDARKRPISDSDPDLDDDMARDAATPPTEVPTPPAGAVPYDVQSLLDKVAATFAEKMGSRIEALEAHVSREMGGISTSLEGTLATMADRLDAHVTTTQNQFDDIKDKIKAIEDRFSAKAAAPSSSYAAASSGGPGAGPPASTPSTLFPTAGPRAATDERAIVLIRGFPQIMPKIVLQDHADEAISIMTDQSKRSVKTRLSPADNKFSFVFTTAAEAADFVTTFTSKGLAYQDPDTMIVTPLRASQGRPLAARRRGAATHQVWAELRAVLDKNPNQSNMLIIMKSFPVNGVWHTDFYGQLGIRLTPLISVTFAEGTDKTTVTKVDYLRDSRVITAAELETISAAATQT